MSATNKTANYNLPQFIGTDKPTWLGDFNNAMSVIDTGMGANKNAIEEIQRVLTNIASTVKAEAIKAAHPVGSYFMSDVPTSPSELFGGVWEVVKDRFLYAAGDLYSAGQVGGEATHTLTVNEMPSHSHHPDDWAVVVSAGGNTGVYATTNGKVLDHYNQQAKKQDYHTSSTGGNGAHNNMPPFKAVYCWKRTA